MRCVLPFLEKREEKVAKNYPEMRRQKRIGPPLPCAQLPSMLRYSQPHLTTNKLCMSWLVTIVKFLCTLYDGFFQAYICCSIFFSTADLLVLHILCIWVLLYYVVLLPWIPTSLEFQPDWRFLVSPWTLILLCPPPSIPSRFVSSPKWSPLSEEIFLAFQCQRRLFLWEKEP